MSVCAAAFAFASAPSFAEAVRKAPEQPDPARHEFYTKRIVRLTGDVNLENSIRVRRELTVLDDINPDNKPITLVIDSPGGSVIPGLAIIDRINTLKSKVDTVCEGQAKSMGAVILAAGTGTRSANENCAIMIHQVSGAASGTVSGMQNSMRETERLNQKLVEILSRATGVRQEDLRNAITADLNILPEEAVAMGLVDKVASPVNKREVKATRSIPEKAIKRSFPGNGLD